MVLVKLLCLSVAVAAAGVLAHRCLLDTPLPAGLDDPAPLRQVVAAHNFVFYVGAAAWFAGATRGLFEPVKLMVRALRAGNAGVEFPGLSSRVEMVVRKDGSQLPMKIDTPQQLQPHQAQQPPTASILYLHGGGYVLNSPQEYHPLTGNLSTSLGLPVFSPDYRKSPEWTHPAALEDGLAALRHLRAHAARYNIDPSRILVAGDSAGGHLSIALTLSLLTAGEAPPRALVLIYPATQLLTTSLPSHLENHLDVFLPESTAAAFRLSYLVGDTADVPVWKANNHSSQALREDFAQRFDLPLLANRGPNQLADSGSAGLAWAIDKYRFAYEDWLLSPLFAPEELLARFPPSLTQTCLFDVLRDEGRLFHERLLRAGSGHRHQVYASVHGMYGFLRTGHRPAVAAMDDVKAFARSALGL